MKGRFIIEKIKEKNQLCRSQLAVDRTWKALHNRISAVRKLPLIYKLHDLLSIMIFHLHLLDDFEVFKFPDLRISVLKLSSYGCKSIGQCSS